MDGEGVERILNGTVTRFTTTHGLLTNHAMNFYAERDGSVWVDPASGGLQGHPA